MHAVPAGRIWPSALVDKACLFARAPADAPVVIDPESPVRWLSLRDFEALKLALQNGLSADHQVNGFSLLQHSISGFFKDPPQAQPGWLALSERLIAAGGGSACNGLFALGSNFTAGSELYVQCNTFPSPTNCLTGKYINFEGTSGPLSACSCYAVCPNGVMAGQVCSASTPDLICTRVRNTAGTSGAAWQNLCRG